MSQMFESLLQTVQIQGILEAFETLYFTGVRLIQSC